MTYTHNWRGYSATIFFDTLIVDHFNKNTLGQLVERRKNSKLAGKQFKKGGGEYMKTFKLKKLEVFENADENITLHEIPLIDGLTINKEDEYNQWVIEAYLAPDYQAFFQELANRDDQIMVQVKITKESNAPATFITSIIGINEIGDYMNVLFLGTIVDRQKGMVRELLRKLVEEGYQGESLIDKFKELI